MKNIDMKKTGLKKTGLGLLAVTLFASCINTRHSAPVAAGLAPGQASTVGYSVNTFHSTFSNDVDVGNAKPSGIHWFVDRWFGAKATHGDHLGFPSGGGITLNDGGDAANYTIGSAAQSRSAASHWGGSAFGGGGYFEAVIQFDTTPVTAPGAEGFPAWWLEPIEHMADPKADIWPGQPPGYENFTEVDIFEYNQWKQHGANVYSGAVHNWYGIYKQTCPQFCRVSNINNLSRFNNYLIQVPANTDYGQPHKYAVLWVPATNSAPGYLQYFFDDKPVSDRVSWSKFTNQAPPPGQAPWTFGVVDTQHLVLILGTGTNQPMTVRSVDVWQASDAQNIHN